MIIDILSLDRLIDKSDILRLYTFCPRWFNPRGRRSEWTLEMVIEILYLDLTIMSTIYILFTCYEGWILDNSQVKGYKKKYNR